MLYGEVVFVDDVVVDLAGFGNLVLYGRELVAKGGKLRVGFQLGVLLDGDEKSGKSSRETFGGFEFFFISGSRGGLIAPASDLGEGFFLMSGVAFDGFDQIGDEVVTGLEADVDLRECVFHAILHSDEVVVGFDAPCDNRDDCRYYYYGDDDTDDGSCRQTKQHKLNLLIIY